LKVDVKRPVYVCGENPGMTLYKPDTDHPIAILSYWHITDSPHGTGNALILWLDEVSVSEPVLSFAGVYTDNVSLAQILAKSLTQYFPEFNGVPVTALPYHEAHCEHNYINGKQYAVTCVSGESKIIVEWLEPLDRRAISIPDFPIGEDIFELHNVVCPCNAGTLMINGEQLQGEIQTAIRADGSPSSTAFLAFAESWVGPMNT